MSSAFTYLVSFQEWLKDTFCLSKVDNKQHNIAEVSLKDMFCSTDVKDKKGRKKVKVCVEKLTFHKQGLSSQKRYSLISRYSRCDGNGPIDHTKKGKRNMSLCNQRLVLSKLTNKQSGQCHLIKVERVGARYSCLCASSIYLRHCTGLVRVFTK